MADLYDLQERRILPNTVETIAEINENIVYNLSRGGGSDVRLPSLWRLAKCVVTEPAALLIYSFPAQ